MARSRKNNPNQPELPIENGGNGGTEKTKAKPRGNGNGETHVLAENVATAPPARPFKPGKIDLPLHRRVDRSFLDYASYVIRDRAIPNLADGLKPVQRRILWALHRIDDGRFMKVANVTGETMK